MRDKHDTGVRTAPSSRETRCVLLGPSRTLIGIETWNAFDVFKGRLTPAWDRLWLLQLAKDGERSYCVSIDFTCL